MIEFPGLLGLTQELEKQSNVVNQVASSIISTITPNWGVFGHAAQAVLQAYDANLATAATAVVNVSKGIISNIADRLSRLNLNPLDLISAVVGALADDVRHLIATLASAEEVTAGVIGELVKHAEGGAGWLIGALAGGVANGLLSSLKTMEGQHREIVDHMLDRILSAKNLPPEIHTATKGLKDRGAEWQALALPFIIVNMLGGMGSAMADPVVREIRQDTNVDFPNVAMDVADIVEARIKGVIGAGEYDYRMSQHGFKQQYASEVLAARYRRLTPQEASIALFRGIIPDTEFDKQMGQQAIDPGLGGVIAETTRPLISPDEARDLYRRGFINEAQHDQILGWHGFATTAIAQKKRLYWLIPGPQDLIHMAIRNVFSEEIVKRFQLFSDFPPPFRDAAAAQGISEDWAIKYWGAHWIVPGNEEGYRMFHRTTDKSDDDNADTFTLSDGSKVQNVIGRSTLQLLLREKDTAPFYRAKLTEIAYNPITRIDLRRMRSVGAISHAGVERGYLDLGYSPVNARRLADYVEKLTNLQLKDRSVPLIDGLKRHTLQLYVQDKLDVSDTAWALTDLGFTDTEAKAFLTEADFIRKQEEIQIVEKGIERLYTSRFIDGTTATARLKAAGISDAGVARLFLKWDLELEFKKDTSEIHKARELTATEVTEAFKAGMIDDATTLAEYEHLGYTPEEAYVKLNLARYQSQRDTRKAQLEAVKSLYVNGVRELAATSNALDAMKLPVDQRDALLAEWTLLREQRTEKIPLATIRDMVRAKFLDRTQATAELRRHRLTDVNIVQLLTFWTGGK